MRGRHTDHWGASLRFRDPSHNKARDTRRRHIRVKDKPHALHIRCTQQGCPDTTARRLDSPRARRPTRLQCYPRAAIMWQATRNIDVPCGRVQPVATSSVGSVTIHFHVSEQGEFSIIARRAYQRERVGSYCFLTKGGWRGEDGRIQAARDMHGNVSLWNLYG